MKVITEDRNLAYLTLRELRSVMHYVPLTNKILLALFRQEVEQNGRI